jgi:hypothetical protein
MIGSDLLPYKVPYNVGEIWFEKFVPPLPLGPW